MTLIQNPQAAANNPEPPKIEFPCPDYPIKVVGVGADNYRQVVIDIVELHAPGFDIEKIRIRDSRNGTFQSMTLFITATGADQLERLHNDLRAHELIRMVI